jgi:hypothetical protein
MNFRALSVGTFFCNQKSVFGSDVAVVWPAGHTYMDKHHHFTKAGVVGIGIGIGILARGKHCWAVNNAAVLGSGVCERRDLHRSGVRERRGFVISIISSIIVIIISVGFSTDVGLASYDTPGEVTRRAHVHT